MGRCDEAPQRGLRRMGLRWAGRSPQPSGVGSRRRGEGGFRLTDEPGEDFGGGKDLVDEAGRLDR
jgi:hypothetical protein